MKRILIVDADPVSVPPRCRALRAGSDRWMIETASTAAAALARAAAQHFDLVLAACSLPDGDGIDLLRQMRDLHPQAARLLLASYAELHMAQRAGAVAYRVLAQPLQAAELVQTCERIFHLQDAFSSPELRAVVGRMGSLDSLSTTYLELNRAVSRADISVAEVAAIVDRDLAMSAKVLQLVNSGFFGLSRSIVSVQAAVSYLGLDTISNLALACETFRLFVPAPGIPADFLASLHGHASRSAAIVAMLPLAPRDREVAVVASLLQDVGELILASRLPEVMLAADALARQRLCPRVAAEESLLGVSHAELGAYLLGLWGIHAMTVEAVAHHHRPNRIPHNGLDSSAAVYLASLLARDLGGTEPVADEHETLAALGFEDQYPMLRVGAAKALAAMKTT